MLPNCDGPVNPNQNVTDTFGIQDTEGPTNTVNVSCTSLPTAGSGSTNTAVATSTGPS